MFSNSVRSFIDVVLLSTCSALFSVPTSQCISMVLASFSRPRFKSSSPLPLPTPYRFAVAGRHVSSFFSYLSIRSTSSLAYSLFLSQHVPSRPKPCMLARRSNKTGQNRRSPTKRLADFSVNNMNGGNRKRKDASQITDKPCA